MRIRLTARLCVALAASLSATASAGADDKAVEVSMRYVAMGSSFAAGSGLGAQKPDTPERCGRSYYNYATLLAEKLRYTLYGVSCGGATTEHILRGWDELPAQIEAVTPDTRLVTVTIGGNDLHYVGNLISESCKLHSGFRMGNQEIPCPEVVAPTEEDYWRLEGNLRNIAWEVNHRAPRAKLVFVQYTTLVPKRLCDATPLSPEAPTWRGKPRSA